MGGGVVFSRECALVEAACVPEGRVREWDHSRQRLAKALGALQLLQVPVSAYLRACRHVYLNRHSYQRTVSRTLGPAAAPRAQYRQCERGRGGAYAEHAELQQSAKLR